MNQSTSLFLAIVVIAAGYAAFIFLFRRHMLRQRALRALQGGETELNADAAIIADNQSPLAQLCTEALAAIGISVADARRADYVRLGKAGLGTDEKASYFYFVRFFIQPFFMVVALLMLIKLLTSDIDLFAMYGMGQILIIFILFLLGIGLHDVVLDKRAKKRRDAITRSFPDAMDLLLVCVEAGMPLDAALARVCTEMKHSHPLIIEEMNRTRMELGVYGDRSETLQNLADRMDTKGFRTLVSALIQTEKYGTNLADTLRILADDLRTERLLFAENKAARVPALITVPVIMFIFFPFIILVMAPPVIKLLGVGGLSQ